MAPELMARRHLDDGSLIEVVPGRWLDVPLYWQCWRIESASLTLLGEVVAAAARVLRQADPSR
jgi:LysR family transcriptional regulator (chromosome initiation inhibitor)